MDAYALTYAAALMISLIIAIVCRSNSRRFGVALMLAAWVTTIAITAAAASNAQPAFFAWLDVVLVWAFCLLGRLSGESWPWRVASCHMAMLIIHPVFAAGGILSDFVYLSALAGLGYLSLIMIAGPPLVAMVEGAVRYARADFVADRTFHRGANISSTRTQAHEKAAP